MGRPEERHRALLALLPIRESWQAALAILNRPLFLISCVFFIFEAVPQPYRDMLWFNPLVHVAGYMRDGYYPFYQPSYVSLVYPLAIGMGTLVVGMFLLNRHHHDLLDHA